MFIKKFILLFKSHWELLVFEFIPITIYVIASYFIDKNTTQNDIILSIIFSPEFVVAVLIAIGAIYSWLQAKEKSDYEKKLQILKDIDIIREFYKDREDELEIIKQCQSQIKKMKKETENFSNEFLGTYLDYVSSKFENNDSNDFPIEYDVYDSNHHVIESKNQDENKVSSKVISLSEIKTMIASKEKTNNMYVRYSKNYMGSSIDSVERWKTWYTLRQNMLDGIKDDDKVIFFTKGGRSYQGCEITGMELKRLIKEVPVRNSKNGNLQYDFYISKNDVISCENANGNNINLSDYGVTELNLTYLNNKI